MSDLVQVLNGEADIIWSKIDIRSHEECWPWTGWCCKRKQAYGDYWCRTLKKHIRAHVAIWLVTRGEIPAGMLVCHSCDYPPCCNPQHLWLGTAADNVRDMHLKGRAADNTSAFNGHRPTGERHGSAKLTADIVRNIRMDQRSNKKLAELYGVSARAIWQVRHGITWGHVK